MSGNGFLHEDEGTTWEGSPEKFIRNDPSSPLHFRRKVPVTVLGATTEEGQHLIAQLINHPWFDLIGVSDDVPSSGKLYGEVVKWTLKPELPSYIAQLPITSFDSLASSPLVFSALNISKSKDIEVTFAEKGCAVISTVKAHLLTKNIPLIVAEVNPDHLSLVRQQGFVKGGMIVVGPTPFAIALSLVLRPIQLEFGISQCELLSQKLEQEVGIEVKKILGTLTNQVVVPYNCVMDITEGAIDTSYLAGVTLTLKQDASFSSLKRALAEYSPISQEMGLPTAPIFPITLTEDPGASLRISTRNLEASNRQKDVGVLIRGLQLLSASKCALSLTSLESLKFTACHSIMNAELLVRAGYIYW